MLTKTLLLIMVLFTIQSYAQTVTNVEALEQLAAEFAAEWDVNAEKVKLYAEEHNVPIRQELEDGRVIEMIDVRDGLPVYYITHNLGAAHTTKAAELWEGGSAGLELNGEGYDNVAVWDAGAVLVSHQEFTDQGASRVTKMDGNYPSHFHATHVGGTIAAAGISPNAKGMAYGVELGSYQWTNDNNEMASAAAGGLELSNHSYGLLSGWSYNGSWQWYGNSNVDPNEDYKFGFYGGDARSMDQIAYNAPNYLIVRSAGNDRGEGPSQGTPENDGGPDGYDCIGQEEVAKNVLTVGAVKELIDYENPGDVDMTSFSSWGPCDDGRIKPDVVGKGYEVYSTLDGNNSDYGSSNGTSMSAPNVTGSLVLLQQHYQNLNGGTPMRSATLKAIAIHTAMEAGPDPGPDYMFGWGLVNVKRGAQLISDGQGQNSIDERVLDGGDLYFREITVPEGTPELRVTICWTDPAGTPVSPQLNPRNPMLVNDLDLKIVDQSNQTHFPFSLDPENPSAAATTDDENDVDNVEMVVITNPEPGNYTIYVDHDGSLNGGAQAYSMIITGIDEYTVTPECSVGMASPADGASDILVNERLEWEPANFASSYDLYFGTDGGGTSTPTNVFNGENITDNGFSYFMEPNTTYYLQVVPVNSVGAADGCNDIWSFTTMEAISAFPYLESFADTEVPKLPFGWQAVENSASNWSSTNLIGHTDNRAMTCFNPAGIVETDYDNWFISPPYAVEAGKEYYVSSYYKSFLPGNAESMTLYWGMGPFISDLSNIVFEDPEFSDANFQHGEGLIIPGEDGYVFLGFYINTEQGYGMFLDDVSLDDWGTVGIDPVLNADQVRIYSHQTNVHIKAGELWAGSKVRIVNLMGQEVYQGKYMNNMNISLQGNAPGLYIVNLGDGKNMISKKILID